MSTAHLIDRALALLAKERWDAMDHHDADRVSVALARVWLARMQDRIFESLPRDGRKLDVLWTEDFLSAIPVGADLEAAKVPILVRILREIALPAVPKSKPGVAAAVQTVIDVLPSGDVKKVREARGGADAAAAAAAAYADAADAARLTAWERIRAIVLEEIGNLEPTP